jgi:hypothetical protein
MSHSEISIEGFSASEWADLPDDLVDGTALTGDPTTFRAGSAQLLAQFHLLEAPP